MQIEAIFDNIAERIEQEIGKANKSIYIAVAWFTNQKLFNSLIEKAVDGCQIFLMVSKDDINLNAQINLKNLREFSSKVFFVGDGDTELMHNKFCVIDCRTVITGSYNWSNKAKSNYENIVITYDDPSLAVQFITEFNSIVKKCYPHETLIDDLFPLGIISKRIEIIRNYITIGDTVEANREAKNLKKYDFNSDIKLIIDDIESGEYASAINKIENFINSSLQITTWTDPHIAALMLEITILENKINAFDNERIEIEKLIGEFQRQHAFHLGEIILELLKLQKLKYKDDKSRFMESERDEYQYRKTFNEVKGNDIIEVTEVERAEIRRLFRKATVLCHPDKFVEEPIEMQKSAEAIFKELNDAHMKNDLKRVAEILADLEKGILIARDGIKATDKEKLKLKISKLKQKIIIIEKQIRTIKRSETYQTIINIPDWDDYFKQTKARLYKKLEELKSEF